MRPLPPYLLNENTLKILENKYILFDTDALVAIIEYKAEKLLKDLDCVNVTKCYIHPVYTELQNTNSPESRVLRQALINNENFIILPLTQKEMEYATNLQKKLALMQIYPSPTDLYLGGILDKYTRSKGLYLLTCNLKDFPYPLFHRHSNIIVQGEKSCKVMTLLSLFEPENTSIIPDLTTDDDIPF